MPVKVVPGLDPFDFAVSEEIAGTSVPYDVSGSVTVKDADRVVDVYIEPKIHIETITREIDTSATGSASVNAAVKLGVEAGVEKIITAKANREITLGGELSLSGTLGQKYDAHYHISACRGLHASAKVRQLGRLLLLCGHMRV